MKGYLRPFIVVMTNSGAKSAPHLKKLLTDRLPPNQIVFIDNTFETTHLTTELAASVTDITTKLFSIYAIQATLIPQHVIKWERVKYRTRELVGWAIALGFQPIYLVVLLMAVVISYLLLNMP